MFSVMNKVQKLFDWICQHRKLIIFSPKSIESNVTIKMCYDPNSIDRNYIKSDFLVGNFAYIIQTLITEISVRAKSISASLMLYQNQARLWATLCDRVQVTVKPHHRDF